MRKILQRPENEAVGEEYYCVAAEWLILGGLVVMDELSDDFNAVIALHHHHQGLCVSGGMPKPCRKPLCHYP